jgi:TolA-binding protein
VEQLSGVGAAVIQDVKILRQQFRQAKQEVDSLEDQLKEMEKKDTAVKEASNREKEDQLILERLGNPGMNISIFIAVI